MYDPPKKKNIYHILFCLAGLYKLDPLEPKKLNLVGLKGYVHKHFSVAVVEWLYAITQFFW